MYDVKLELSFSQAAVTYIFSKERHEPTTITITTKAHYLRSMVNEIKWISLNIILHDVCVSVVVCLSFTQSLKLCVILFDVN